MWLIRVINLVSAHKTDLVQLSESSYKQMNFMK